MEPRGTRVVTRIMTLLTLAFLYIPLVIIVMYAFNDSIGQKWPIASYTTRWFGVAFRNPDVRTALVNSLLVAALATFVALLLGSAAAFAVHRFSFFGRNSVSFVLVLPIALPGIITGIALNSAINAGGFPFSLWTIILGHATFCVVVVYNNILARLRRTQTSLVEASMDLGADGWQTFRFVTFPSIATAVVAGSLLAFALSFDEIIVTNFVSGAELTLPKWIFNNLRQPRNRPVVNVVAVTVMVLSLIPVYFAQRLAGGVSLTGATQPDAGSGPEGEGGQVLASETAP